MAKCQKYLHDIFLTFTDIRASQVMNRCQIITMYLNGNKTYGQKLLLQGNLELVVLVRDLPRFYKICC
jgi:hypothetical protein